MLETVRDKLRRALSSGQSLSALEVAIRAGVKVTSARGCLLSHPHDFERQQVRVAGHLRSVFRLRCAPC